MADTDIQFFDIVETIGTFIQDNVVDIHTTRDGNRWIFPTFPKRNSSLPQVTIQLGQPTYENDSAGDYLYSESLDNGDYKEYYYKKATYIIHLFIISSKEQEIQAGELFLTNQPLNLYITNSIKYALFKHRGKLLKSFDNFRLENISPVFENNKYSWSSDIACSIKAKDVWCKEYHNGQLIREYTLNANTV